MLTSDEDHLLGPWLSSDDCLRCRTCCLFAPARRQYAPFFTAETRQQVLQTFPDRQLHFTPHGSLWQIELWPLPNDPQNYYVCPFYDVSTARCDIYPYRPFDCLIWPFYIMRQNDEIVITVSPACEAVAHYPMAVLTAAVQGPLGRYIVAEARQCPDLITEYYDNALVLLTVTGQFAPRPGRAGPACGSDDR